MTKTEVQDISSYISKLVRIHAGENSLTPLNPHRAEELNGKLIIKAAKAEKRHNPAISPLIPFVKKALKIEAAREAARLFDKQMKRGEHCKGDLSLDAMVSPGEEESFIDMLGESDETVRRRRIKRDVREVLLHLTKRERTALEALMYSDITKEITATILGVSRPTLDHFLKEQAIPHFVALWHEFGKKLR